MDRVCVALDVETTGLEAGIDEIIEVGAVKFQGDEVLETFQSFVQPRHALPLKITRLTGITDADLADAPRFIQIAPDLVRFVKSYPVVGHSIGFDIKMLGAQGLRLPQASYDTFELATLLLPNAPNYKLGSLAAVLGIPHPDAHRATADADVARQVFLKLVARIEALSLKELDEVIRLTGKLNWPLRPLFEEAQRLRAKNAFLEPPTEESKPEERWPKTEPLKPRDDAKPIDVDAVRAFFAPDGALGRAFPGYEQRPQQVAMAEAVAEALNSSSHLVVEAGTGVGKSMAYIVPAALHAINRGERVVVSTNTINLQDQLAFKDLPDVQRLLDAGAGGQGGSEVPARSPHPPASGAPLPPSGEAASPRASAAGGAPERAAASSAPLPFQAAILKGRGNYLCLKRYKEARRDGRLTDEEIRTLLKVQLWLPHTERGDKAELPLYDREATAWGRVNVTPETCTGPRCPEFNRCFYFKARREAEAAHIVVVNHALLLADLQTEANVLPPYDHLVIDEAHNLEDVATDQLGFSLDQAAMLDFLDGLFQDSGANLAGGLLAELPKYFSGSAAGSGDIDKANELSRGMGPVVVRARASVYDFFNRISAFMTGAADVSAYDPRLRLTPAIRQHPDWPEIVTAWGNVAAQLNLIGDALGRLEAMLTGSLKDAELLEYDALLIRVQALKRFATETRIAAGHVVNGDAAEQITWLVFDRQRDAIELHAAPLSVAELLRTNLFTQKSTVVMASATATVNNTFDFVVGRVGLDDARELQLDSPFDYQKQAFVYLPNDIPEPNHNGYQQMVERTLIDLCAVTGGRALVLFTANNALRTTYRAIQEPLEAHGVTVLAQGVDGSRRSLIQRFKETPGTVLLGTTSFWEGVDVVGDALSVLVIAKLPFGVPTDPVYAARSEQFVDPFSEYSVPQSILRFKQGFGRLIRAKSDRGMVVVLDKRLLSKKYGQTFLASLPPALVRAGPVKSLPGLATRFLKTGA